MRNELIKTTIEDHVAVVTLDNPPVNAQSRETMEELIEVFDELNETKGVRCIVLTATGKVFSAGADLAEVEGGDIATSPEWERLSGAIAALPCLSVAALNGTLAGGAMGMALACDLRIAVPAANFFYPALKRGVLPQPSDPMRMAALIGPARAKLILMAGQKITSEEALAFGLIDRIVPGEELMTVARTLLQDTLGADPALVAGVSALCS